MSRLTIARTVGESVAIGDDIVVTVVGLVGGVVRLCIEAPRRLDVSRTNNRASKAARAATEDGEGHGGAANKGE